MNLSNMLIAQGCVMQVCVTLGGDHSIGLGTLAGSLQHDPDTVVIWVKSGFSYC